nr:RNA-directed DNA polymerase, eukaryota, reverse transcriptase zinc-binding domain protein [Tanacetum cinerariifolium]
MGGLGVASLLAKNLVALSGPNVIWCDIIKVVEDIEIIDPSFKRSFHIKVLNGANVSFWKDPWCENGTMLMDLFPRLYALDSSQDCKLVDQWHLVDGCWGENWHWRHPPCGRANDDVMDLVSMIGSLSLSSASTDGLGPKTLLEDINHYLINCPVCYLYGKNSGVGGTYLLYVFSPRLISKTSLWVRFASKGYSLSNKVMHGVFQSTFWAIWNWRNKIINAHQDRVDSIKQEDIFPSI